MTFLLVLATATLAITAVTAVQLTLGARRIRALREVDPAQVTDLPRVSIVVAARNEERNIREALQSLLSLDYPDYELIVVDDRSEDGTGSILDDMGARFNRLRVVHVASLPAGWLGKNHALSAGSRQATGKYLLFTDADVVMEKTLLTRAVGFMQRYHLDHLAATPSMRMPGVFLEMFGASFVIFFSLFSRPWKARDPRSRCHIGIGAFNMLRSSAYRLVGGHEAIRLLPDDDIKLGKLIKRAGLRQDAALAPEYMSVEWYATCRVKAKSIQGVWTTLTRLSISPFQLAAPFPFVSLHLAYYYIANPINLISINFCRTPCAYIGTQTRIPSPCAAWWNKGMVQCARQQKRERWQMARLIDELKRDHVEIEAMLAKVRDNGITNKEAHNILIAARVKLLAHLKKEDIQLYPVLNKAAVNDATLKRSVEFYAKDMQEIPADAVAFFDKYPPADATIDIEFAKAFGRLYSTISRRLRSEEGSLYKAYETVHPL